MYVCLHVQPITAAAEHLCSTCASLIFLYSTYPFAWFAMCAQDTYDIWQKAIAYCKPGKHYKGIGGVIEDLCTAKGYTTVPNFCESFVSHLLCVSRSTAKSCVLSSGICHTFVVLEGPNENYM